MIIEVLIFLILLLYIKWILYIIALPVMMCWYNRQKGKFIASFGKKEEMANPPTSSQHICIYKKLKSRCRSIFIGYMRFHDFATGYIPSNSIRYSIYKYVYKVDMEENVIVHFGAEIRAPHQLKIGKGSIIGDKCILDARRGGIVIGNNVNISSQVCLWTGQHDYNDPWFRSNPSKRGPIKIGDRAWLGPNVTVLHSVTIGEGAVVAAGAVVTKDVEPFTLVGGIPAKKIGDRNRDLRYEFNGESVAFY